MICRLFTMKIAPSEIDPIHNFPNLIALMTNCMQRNHQIVQVLYLINGGDITAVTTGEFYFVSFLTVLGMLAQPGIVGKASSTT